MFVSPSLVLQAAKQRIESEAAAQRQPGILQRWFPGWMSGYQWQPQQQGADQVSHTRCSEQLQCTVYMLYVYRTRLGIDTDSVCSLSTCTYVCMYVHVNITQGDKAVLHLKTALFF